MIRPSEEEEAERIDPRRFDATIIVVAKYLKNEYKEIKWRVSGSEMEREILGDLGGTGIATPGRFIKITVVFVEKKKVFTVWMNAWTGAERVVEKEVYQIDTGIPIEKLGEEFTAREQMRMARLIFTWIKNGLRKVEFD